MSSDIEYTKADICDPRRASADFFPSLLQASCPVCHHSIAVPFFSGGEQPLATLGWPASKAEAVAMERLPLDFVQCPRCSHVWNRAFVYDAIPYRQNPNRMFNVGTIWRGYLAEACKRLLAHLPPNPGIIEIGCGEGHFLRGLAAAGGGRCVGFDPNSGAESGLGVEFYPRYFKPLSDLAEFAPDAVVMRHVLEHLTDPAVFVEQLAWAAVALDKPIWLFAEVPCIDRVFSSGRLADFYYEHSSQFTTQSFRALMELAGDVVDLAHGYDGEVVFALVKLGVPAPMRGQAQTAIDFARAANASRVRVRMQLDELAARGRRIAIWGGTGKAAAFIQQFGADAQRFPLVVDSDPTKAGTFVPGTGQEILFRDALKTAATEVVIIPTQWRAKDIVAEMAREGIEVALVLIEHGGKLVNYHGDIHPYR